MELLHAHSAGLDVHKETVVACIRHMADGQVTTEVNSFSTTARELMELSEWLSSQGVTHIVMEATGVYWKPVWHILSDGEFQLVLANAGVPGDRSSSLGWKAAHVKNVPGRKTDVKDAEWLADLLAHHYDNRAKGKHVLRLVNRLQNLGFDVQITPLAA